MQKENIHRYVTQKKNSSKLTNGKIILKKIQNKEI